MRFIRRRILTMIWSRTASRCASSSTSAKLLEELFETDRRIDHDRLHLGEVLQMRIEIDRVEDAEGLLADLRALPRRAAKHLLIEDAAVHPAQEHQVLDLRHVDARS